ncbi:g9342 [Coccomyxa elongata]
MWPFIVGGLVAMVSNLVADFKQHFLGARTHRLDQSRESEQAARQRLEDEIRETERLVNENQERQQINEKLEQKLRDLQEQNERDFSTPIEATDELIQRARDMYRQKAPDFETNFNIAIVGIAGTGKSSLINALRRTPFGHRDYAGVGEVESTREPTVYNFPGSLKVKLWDFPGAGVPQHPARTYLDDNALYAFDALIVNSADRLTVVDVYICCVASNFYHLPVALLRSKTDQAVEAKRRRTLGPKLSDEQYIQQLRDEWRSSINRNLDLVSPHNLAVNHDFFDDFLVSAWMMDELPALLDGQPHPPYADNQRFARWCLDQLPAGVFRVEIQEAPEAALLQIEAPPEAPAPEVQIEGAPEPAVPTSGDSDAPQAPAE